MGNKVDEWRLFGSDSDLLLFDDPEDRNNDCRGCGDDSISDKKEVLKSNWQIISNTVDTMCISIKIKKN